MSVRQGGTKIALRGEVTRRPIFPTPRPPLLGRRDGRGGSGRGCPTCRAGGGVNPTSMAQSDTHVALIILTTQMWGGGIIGGKNFFRPKICVPAPSPPTSVLTQNKGPDTEPHFSTPPPLPSAGVHVTPPPPAEQFSGCLGWGAGLGPFPKCPRCLRTRALCPEGYLCLARPTSKSMFRPSIPEGCTYTCIRRRIRVCVAYTDARISVYMPLCTGKRR